MPCWIRDAAERTLIKIVVMDRVGAIGTYETVRIGEGLGTLGWDESGHGAAFGDYKRGEVREEMRGVTVCCENDVLSANDATGCV